MLLEVNDVGSGPVVVLIHGFPLDRTMWRAQVEPLAAHYRLITPNLRGVGGSSVPEGVYAIDLLADDVIETLDSLGITQPVVGGGLSMGGYVALAMVANYPQRLRGLLLLDTRAIGDAPATAETREVLARRVEASGSVAEVIATMIPILFAPATHGDQPEIVEAIRSQALRSNPQALANTLRGLAIRPDRTGMLGSIGIPTLVIAGADEQIVPLAETQALAAAIPGARLEIIPKAGHLAPLENPGATNSALLAFLDSLGE